MKMRWALLLLPPAAEAACDLTRGKWVRDDAYRSQALQHYKPVSYTHLTLPTKA